MPQITVIHVLCMENSMIKYIRSDMVNSTISFSWKRSLLILHGFVLWSFSSYICRTFSKDHLVFWVYYRVSTISWQDPSQVLHLGNENSDVHKIHWRKIICVWHGCQFGLLWWMHWKGMMWPLSKGHFAMQWDTVCMKQKLYINYRLPKLRSCSAVFNELEKSSALLKVFL
jgi:hypothetical protein